MKNNSDLKIVKMKYNSDCEVAMIATICNVSWNKAQKALGWKQLQYGLENPFFGNPFNVYRSLLKLGYWKQNLNWKQFQKGDRCCVLIHFPDDPYFKQHWIIRDKIDEKGNNYCYFGKSDDYTIIHNDEMRKLIFKGFPNCMFKVYKCNIVEMVVERIKLKIKQIISRWIK